MTSYPRRDTTYPLITIKDINLESISPLGMQSEAMLITISIEVRIWARNTKERDVLADQIYHLLRTNQIGTSGTNQANDLHDFKMISSVNVDEDTIKSKVMTFEYKAVIG